MLRRFFVLSEIFLEKIAKSICFFAYFLINIIRAIEKNSSKSRFFVNQDLQNCIKSIQKHPNCFELIQTNHQQIHRKTPFEIQQLRQYEKMKELMEYMAWHHDALLKTMTYEQKKIF